MKSGERSRFFRTTVEFLEPEIPMNTLHTPWRQKLWHHPWSWTSRYQKQSTLISTWGCMPQGQLKYLPNPSWPFGEFRHAIVQRSGFPMISFPIDLFTCSRTRLPTPSRVWHEWVWKMSKIPQVVYFCNSQFGIFTWCSSVGLWSYQSLQRAFSHIFYFPTNLCTIPVILGRKSLTI